MRGGSTRRGGSKSYEGGRPQTNQLELVRQVPNVSYQDIVKEVSLTVHQAQEKIVEVPFEKFVEVPKGMQWVCKERATRVEGCA